MIEHLPEEQNTIGPNTRVPLYITYGVICTVLPLAIYGTILWANIKSEVADKVSYYQLQQHDYDLKLLNPNINLPPPIKPNAAVGFVEPKDLLKSVKFSLNSYYENN